MDMDYKKYIMPLTLGALLIIIGAVSATIGAAMGNFIIQTLNNTAGVNIPSEYNFLSTNIINIVSAVFIFAGVSLIIMAVSFIIKKLKEAALGAAEGGV